MAGLNCTPLQDRVASQPPDLIQYRVTDKVVLAGQPQPQDWADLAGQGYQLVLNLRSDPQRAAVEGRNAEAAGLRYLHLPLPAYELEPEHLAEFREALAQADGGQLFIHCRTASRVALLWMLNRIVHEGWSQEAAEAELRAAGYDDKSMEVFTFCTEDYMERITAFPMAASNGAA
jgi:uncharacterized protein (TIGR01244 family)